VFSENTHCSNVTTVSMAEKKESPGSSTVDSPDHVEEKRSPSYGGDSLDVSRNKLSAIFENPLGGIPREQLMKDVDDFCAKFDLMQYNDTIRKGALVAQSPHAVQNMDELTDQEKLYLEREHTHKWSQPKTLYYLVRQTSRLPFGEQETTHV